MVLIKDSQKTVLKNRQRLFNDVAQLSPPFSARETTGLPVRIDPYNNAIVLDPDQPFSKAAVIHAGIIAHSSDLMFYAKTYKQWNEGNIAFDIPNSLSASIEMSKACNKFKSTFVDLGYRQYDFLIRISNFIEEGFADTVMQAKFPTVWLKVREFRTQQSSLFRSFTEKNKDTVEDADYILNLLYSNAILHESFQSYVPDKLYKQFCLYILPTLKDALHCADCRNRLSYALLIGVLIFHHFKVINLELGSAPIKLLSQIVVSDPSVSSSRESTESPLISSSHGNTDDIKVSLYHISSKAAHADVSRELPEISLGKHLAQKWLNKFRLFSDNQKVTGLYFGTRLESSSFYRLDCKYYSKVSRSLKNSLAIAVLIDQSGSMAGDNLTACRKFAFITYAFCNTLGIPISIFGHTAWYNGTENVSLVSYIDMFHPSPDEEMKLMEITYKDYYGSQNRDGCALRYMGNYLSHSNARKKLLFQITDGIPQSHYYFGEAAKQDIEKALIDCKKNKITVITAGIGTEEKEIRKYYPHSFLSIGDTENLPHILLQYLQKVLENL